MIRSCLRYPGGKFKALSQIMPLIPYDIEDWREPFFGGGSVTIGYLQSGRKRPKRIIVGDLATEVYVFWSEIQAHTNQVIEEVKNIYYTYNKSYNNESYNENDRGLDEQVLNEATELFKFLKTVECENRSKEWRAARLFLINHISFSAMGDSGTLSFDQYKEFSMEYCKRITETSRILDGVEIRHCSYAEILFDDVKNKDKTFAFMDPPYYSQEGSKLYGRDGDMHTGFMHEDLAKDCDKIKYKWLMTYDDCFYIRRLYKNKYIKPFEISYTLAGKTSEDALAGEELFIANYELQHEGSFRDIFKF